MIKERITTAIKEVIDGDCGFDVFVKMKSEDNIRKLILDEGSPQGETENFKAEVRLNIKNAIESKFLCEEVEYCPAGQMEDNQKKFYAIKQDESYHPFNVINVPEDQIQSFSVSEKDDVQGFLFRFAVNGKTLWAYQHLWPVAIPNKRGENWLIRALSPDHSDVFTKLNETILTITHKVDLLIVTSVLDGTEMGTGDTVTEIVTSDTSLMETNFALEVFIKVSAHSVMKSIKEVGLVSNMDKIDEYLQRGGGNKRYARKLMRVQNSKVFTMSVDELKGKLKTVDRWKGRFQMENNKIVLNTYRDVEALIDLFDERYTRSEITGQEYDTAVKSVAISPRTSGTASN